MLRLFTWDMAGNFIGAYCRASYEVTVSRSFPVFPKVDTPLRA